jgi:hypothetical protein
MTVRLLVCAECGVTTNSMLFVAKREPARAGGGSGGGGGQQYDAPPFSPPSSLSLMVSDHERLRACRPDAAQVQQYFRTNPDALTQLLHVRARLSCFALSVVLPHVRCA